MRVMKKAPFEGAFCFGGVDEKWWCAVPLSGQRTDRSKFVESAHGKTRRSLQRAGRLPDLRTKKAALEQGRDWRAIREFQFRE
jgi:hypothetical protein